MYNILLNRESALREREEQVRRQKQELGRENQGKRNRLIKEESTTLFKTMLTDLIKNHQIVKSLSSSTSSAWNACKALLSQSDPSRWNSIIDSKSLHESELDSLFQTHCKNLLQKHLQAFHSLIQEITGSNILMPFSEIQDVILADPRTIRLDLKEDEIQELYEAHQNERKAQSKEGLEACLKENAFIRFHVKQAVQSVHVKAVEQLGLKEAAVGEEWKEMSLEDIKKVIQYDKRYMDYAWNETERDRIVFLFVKELIEQARKEKGGTLDRIVAAHAGGNITTKKAATK